MHRLAEEEKYRMSACIGEERALKWVAQVGGGGIWLQNKNTSHFEKDIVATREDRETIRPVSLPSAKWRYKT